MVKQSFGILKDIKPQAEIESQEERRPKSKKAKPGKLNDPKHVVGRLSPVEYRYFLRFYNIKNYPERGTENDPEMIDGKPSNWKQAGYPEFKTKKGIADDLGVSKNRGQQAYKKGLAKVKAASQAAYGDTGVQLEGVSPNHTILKECIETITRELVRFFIIDD
jgi:hypothetical protein